MILAPSRSRQNIRLREFRPFTPWGSKGPVGSPPSVGVTGGATLITPHPHPEPGLSGFPTPGPARLSEAGRSAQTWAGVWRPWDTNLREEGAVRTEGAQLGAPRWPQPQKFQQLQRTGSWRLPADHTALADRAQADISVPTQTVLSVDTDHYWT
uniref:Uncharacterized protein n=1 Tax=Molossus molossus TaxID=27622 RepID=A0A7J8I0T2_MOLMO|nr:hypothetical protein HJG59_010777 [Molossus molossus]